MTLEEIKQAVEDGHKVHLIDDNYQVVKDILGQWFIRCTHNRHCIGLTWADGVTMNGKPDDFYIGHVWGPIENARFTGEPHRKCQVAGCRAITLDGDDE